MFPKIVVPQNGWFIMENLIKMDDLGTHYFRKHPYRYHKPWNFTSLDSAQRYELQRREAAQQSLGSPEVQHNPSKMDGWKTILSFWDDHFSGAMYIYIYTYMLNLQNVVVESPALIKRISVQDGMMKIQLVDIGSASFVIE